MEARPEALSRLLFLHPPAPWVAEEGTEPEPEAGPAPAAANSAAPCPRWTFTMLPRPPILWVGEGVVTALELEEAAAAAAALAAARCASLLPGAGKFALAPEGDTTLLWDGGFEEPLTAPAPAPALAVGDTMIAATGTGEAIVFVTAKWSGLALTSRPGLSTLGLDAPDSTALWLGEGGGIGGDGPRSRLISSSPSFFSLPLLSFAFSFSARVDKPVRPAPLFICGLLLLAVPWWE